MTRKQKDYLAALLAEEEQGTAGEEASPSPPPSALTADASRTRGMTLLGRESALARVASGEVRQVTQLLLDPARVRVWAGNARVYANLTEDNCRELIDSILAEGGQKVPAVVRRVEGDPAHDYEVIAGTRRHFSISWLRKNSYPDMKFVAQVAQLDDEAAFRLADIENRARKDVTDLERARNYAQALATHYGGHQGRMAERLKLSKGWLSKLLKVAAIPDEVIGAFANPADVQLAPAYSLAQALDDPKRTRFIYAEAARIAREQHDLRPRGSFIPAQDVLRRLLTEPHTEAEQPYVYHSRFGRPAMTLLTSNRQGLTIRVHAGSGAGDAELVEALTDLIAHLRRTKPGLTL